MSKGNFGPGKRVLLLRSNKQNIVTQHLVGTTQTLEAIADNDFDYERDSPRWLLRGVRSERGFRVCWSQKLMIPLDDPDLETTEQSTEAMRRLHETPAKEPVVKPFQWEEL